MTAITNLVCHYTNMSAKLHNDREASYMHIIIGFVMVIYFYPYIVSSKYLTGIHKYVN